MAQRRDGTPTLTTQAGVTTHLERLQFGDRGIDENWLQELMHKSPDVLPIDEIDPGFSPLVPIGREISTAVGPIDNLYVSPSGLLTLVEAKLWRNPQARRELIGLGVGKAEDSWDRSANLGDIASVYDSFKTRIERFAVDVCELREKADEEA